MRPLYAANRPLTVRSQRTIHHNLAISATRASTSACVVAQLVQKRTTVPCSSGAGAIFLLADVRSAQLTGRVKELQTDGGPVLARTVVLATGAGPRRLGLPQEDELHGVSYCAACDGAV